MNALLFQSYPKHLLEILVVNDQSTDDTEQVLQQYQRFSQVRVLNTDIRKKYKSSKKSALETAILSANGEILLFTDADCVPPPKWAATMMSFFKPDTALVASLSPQTAEQSWWSDIQLCDSLAAALVSAGGIGFGHGITCTGRNLAYRKQVFEKIGGFQSTPDSLSGDDDFILQRMAKLPGWRVAYAVDPHAVVPSKGPKNLGAFLKQKRRHISAGKHFSLPQQAGYGLFHLTNILLWLTPFIDLIYGTQFFILLIVKLVFDALLLRCFAVKFRLKLNLPTLFLWDALFVGYNSLFAFTAFKTPKSWK